MALDRGLKTLVIDRVDRDRVGRTSALLRLRLVLVVVAIALAGAWWAWAGGSRPGLLYNPGHVTAVHAKFETDCAKCHDGDGRGGFARNVSDGACVKCHDGAIHHPNQLMAADAKGVSRDTLVLAVNDPHRPPANPSRSAACMACHTEHKGHDRLLSFDDAQCTQCHAVLTKTATSQPAVQARIAAFDPANHPAFGRALMREDAGDKKVRMFDPTKLKFDHRKHAAVPELTGDQSCVLCHSTAVTPGPGPPPRTPPFATEKLAGDDRPYDSGAWMRPVSFDRHCVGCHQLETANTVASIEIDEDGEKIKKDVSPAIAGLVLRHRSMSEVRDQIAAAVQAQMPSDPTKFAGPDTADMPADVKAMAVDKKWLRLNLLAMADDISAGIKRRGLESAFDPATLKVPDDLPADKLTVSRFIDVYTAQAMFSAKSACVACHDASGQLPGFADASPAPLATVPTGIPATPRHWFAKSQFDHKRHAQMSCVECHSTLSTANLTRIAAIGDATQQKAEARVVSETSFVHSPNQTWTQWAMTDGKPTAKDRSCAECHHTDRGSADRGNGAACVLCHTFHDRTREQPPDRK